MRTDMQQCALCELEVECTSRHHLIPRQKSKGLARELRTATIRCCVPCGKQVHALFTNGELKRQFNTLEKLKADAQVQKWISWRRKCPRMVDIRYSQKRS